jgi:DNA-binding transcriptional LysR family regulator
MFPVCAPALWAGLVRDLSPGDFLARNTLLHYAERPHWAAWVAQARLDPVLALPGPRFGETALALAAAEAGQGVAIAWGVLVADALAEGRLVRPFAQALADGTGYHLVMTENAARRPAVQAFAAWISGCLGAEPS